MKKIGRKIKISHYIMSVMLIAVLLFNEFLLSFSQLIAPTEIETSALSEKGETVGLTGTKIAANLKDYIGKEVDWHTQNPATQDIKWKILYADNTGLYLIASDYVDITSQTPRMYNRMPGVYPGDGPFPLKTKTTNYQGYWTKDLCVQYSTWRPVGSSTEHGASYFFGNPGQFYSLSNWMAHEEERDKAAAAYMLDTERWNPLYESPDLMSAWGGPTLEIMDKVYKTEDPSLPTFYEVGNYGYSITDYNIGKSTRAKLLVEPEIQSGVNCDFATWFIAPNSIRSERSSNVFEEIDDSQEGNKMYIGNSYNMGYGNAWANVLDLGTQEFYVRISTCCTIKYYSCS